MCLHDAPSQAPAGIIHTSTSPRSRTKIILTGPNKSSKDVLAQQSPRPIGTSATHRRSSPPPGTGQSSDPRSSTINSTSPTRRTPTRTGISVPSTSTLPALGAGARSQTRTERSHSRCPSTTGNSPFGRIPYRLFRCVLRGAGTLMGACVNQRTHKPHDCVGGSMPTSFGGSGCGIDLPRHWDHGVRKVDRGTGVGRKAAPERSCTRRHVPQVHRQRPRRDDASLE